jgi:IS1 family transposase
LPGFTGIAGKEAIVPPFERKILYTVFCKKPYTGVSLELLRPLNLGQVYTDGNYVYYERFSSEVLVVTKKNIHIERKHLSLRTWGTRLVRKGIRFSKTEQIYKIVIALIINIWFLG